MISRKHIHVHTYMYIYTYLMRFKLEEPLHNPVDFARGVGALADAHPLALRRPIGIYKILLSPILYGVCHTKARSRRCPIVRDSRATALQQCGQCRWAGGRKGWLIRAQWPRSKRISCEGQVAKKDHRWWVTMCIGCTRDLHIQIQ